MSAIDQLAATLATMAEALGALTVWWLDAIFIVCSVVIGFTLWAESVRRRQPVIAPPPRPRPNPFMGPWKNREPGDLSSPK